MEKQQQELLRVQDLLRVQVVLGNMSHERAKSDFLAGKHGALVSVWKQFLYQAICTQKTQKGSEWS